MKVFNIFELSTIVAEQSKCACASLLLHASVQLFAHFFCLFTIPNSLYYNCEVYACVYCHSIMHTTKAWCSPKRALINSRLSHPFIVSPQGVSMYYLCICQMSPWKVIPAWTWNWLGMRGCSSGRAKERQPCFGCSWKSKSFKMNWSQWPIGNVNAAALILKLCMLRTSGGKVKIKFENSKSWEALPFKPYKVKWTMFGNA